MIKEHTFQVQKLVTKLLIKAIIKKNLTFTHYFVLLFN